MDLFDELKAAARDDWLAYVDHAFVRALGEGTLPERCFRHYLVQDYLFLVQFARAYGLAAYKANRTRHLRTAARGLIAIVDTEMDLHVRTCARWGIDADALERAPEAAATVAYTRFVLDTGMRGDLLDLFVALAPCMLGYAEIGRDLAARQAGVRENPYREWIDEYSGAPYQQAAAETRALLDELAAAALTPARRPELEAVFRKATRLEAAFWDMGLGVCW